MKNLKPYKEICLLALFFFLNVFASKADNADVSISAFKIYPENLAPGGGLNVPDKNANTSFKFHVDLSRFSRSTGGYYSGNCSFVLVYKDNYGATIDLASKDVTDANFNDASGRPTSSAIIPMTAVLPQGKLNGILYIRFKYFNSSQNKELTEDRTNQYISVVATGSSPSDIAKIGSMGFSTEGIIQTSEYFLVEGDIMLSNFYVLNYPNNSLKINNSNINIMVDKSIWASRSIWYNSVKDAIEVWNSAPNSNIKLHFFQSGYDNPERVDIYVREDNGRLPASVAARARFPEGYGKAGDLILVNTDFNGNSNSPFGNLTPGQATWNMLHQIGHCLGLKHTSQALGDQLSLMNRGTFYTEYSRSNRGIDYALPSANDEAAINALHPKDPGSTLDPSIGGGGDWYFASYVSKEKGINYRWEMVGMDGVSDYFDFGKLSDTNYPAFDSSYLGKHGTFQLKCTISGGKYTTPKSAVRTVVY